MCGTICGERGGFVDRLANADVRTAAADVAVHRGVDILVGGFRVLGKQSGGGHHLAGLAVAALRYVDFGPSELHGMRAISGETFDGGDLSSIRGGNWRLAGTHCASAEMHSARSALADSAAIFGAAKIQDIAKNPEQGHIFRDVDRSGFTVDCEFVGHS